MMFVKILLIIILYLVVGIAINVLLCRLDESFDCEISDTAMLIMSSFFWPLVVVVFILKTFTEKIALFFSDLFDRIEAIKEEREMEDDDA